MLRAAVCARRKLRRNAGCERRCRCVAVVVALVLCFGARPGADLRELPSFQAAKARRLVWQHPAPALHPFTPCRRGEAGQMSIVKVLNTLTGVAHYTGLERTGVTRAELACAVCAGEVLRVRNGWFASPSAPPDVVRAVRVGGALTASSVAQLRELWTIADPQLHVRVRSTAGRLSSPEGGAALDRQRDSATACACTIDTIELKSTVSAFTPTVLSKIASVTGS